MLDGQGLPFVSGSLPWVTCFRHSKLGNAARSWSSVSPCSALNRGCRDTEPPARSQPAAVTLVWSTLFFKHNFPVVGWEGLKPSCSSLPRSHFTSSILQFYSLFISLVCCTAWRLFTATSMCTSSSNCRGSPAGKGQALVWAKHEAAPGAMSGADKQMK